MTERKPKVKLTNKDIKKITDKVVKDHQNQPKPQMLIRRADNVDSNKLDENIDVNSSKLANSIGKKLTIIKRPFVAWGFEGNSSRLTRNVKELEFVIDLTNTKKEDKLPSLDDLVKDCVDIAECDGWYLTDRRAFNANLDIVTNNLDRLANEIHRDEICRHAAGDIVLSCSQFIRDGRAVLRLLKKLNTQLKNPVTILPNLEKVEVKDGVLVQRTEKKCKCDCKGKCSCKKNKSVKKTQTKKGK